MQALLGVTLAAHANPPPAVPEDAKRAKDLYSQVGWPGALGRSNHGQAAGCLTAAGQPGALLLLTPGRSSSTRASAPRPGRSWTPY